MSERKNGSNGAAAKPDVDALRDDIKQTRAELGETVQALAAKADVKARAKDQVEQTKQRVKAQAAQATDKVRAAALQATDKVKDTALHASDKVKETAQQASDKVRGNGTADGAATTAGGPVLVPVSERAGGLANRVQAVAQEAGGRIRRSPVPAAGMLVAGAALLVVLLIVRGRRR